MTEEMGDAGGDGMAVDDEEAPPPPSDVSLQKNPRRDYTQKLKVDPPVFSFSRPESSSYFSCEKDGLGSAYLVANSQFHLPNVAKKINPSEI